MLIWTERFAKPFIKYVRVLRPLLQAIEIAAATKALPPRRLTIVIATLHFSIRGVVVYEPRLWNFLRGYDSYGVKAREGWSNHANT